MVIVGILELFWGLKLIGLTLEFCGFAAGFIMTMVKLKNAK